MIIIYHLIASTLGLLLDRVIGDPPKLPHPVRWIGTAIQALTHCLNNGTRRFFKGVLLTTIVVGSVLIIVLVISVITYRIHWLLYLVVQTIFIMIGLAQKSLAEAALAVYEPLLDKHIVEARDKLSWIVGRDTAQLNEADITRGVVETVSENTSDGVTAPLFWAFIFGATGLWVYKAINTLDSMVGYRNERFQYFGKCSAKLDDIVNYIPSRLTGFLIILCTRHTSEYSLKERLKNWVIDASKHPSPNSGYLEAATAYQLGIQLGGINYYEGIASHRATMGQPVSILSHRHIKAVIQQMHQAVFAFWCVLTSVGGIIIYVTQPWS